MHKSVIKKIPGARYDLRSLRGGGGHVPLLPTPGSGPD